jgi:nucleoid-associated protein YgaU
MSTPTPLAALSRIDPGLVRAYLEIVNPTVTDLERIIPFRFNPAEYQLKKTQTIAEIGIPGLSSPAIQWVRGGARTLSFDAVFDTSDTMTSVDLVFVDRLKALLEPNAKLHAPPIVAFVWGPQRFTGVLEGLQVSYTLFSQLGLPLRAKANISLKEFRTARVQVIENRRSSPDVEKTYLVRRGDTFPSIAAAVFKDPARWRELALANGYTDTQALQPGDRLRIPELTARR